MVNAIQTFLYNMKKCRNKKSDFISGYSVKNT